jgi:hypothetical protein
MIDLFRRWSPPEFNRDSIRLLVFSDSDDVGLELIFDSKTLRIVIPVDNDNIANRLSTTTNTDRTPTTRSLPVSVRCLVTMLIECETMMYVIQSISRTWL